MSEELKRMRAEETSLKSILLQNSNIDILLYLAKYNPKVNTKEITTRFGKRGLEGLRILVHSKLVKEENNNVTLTEEGIFQVDGLLSLVI